MEEEFSSTLTQFQVLADMVKRVAAFQEDYNRILNLEAQMRPYVIEEMEP
jgi:hypothetical protein